MIPREILPEDAANWTEIDVSLSYRDTNSQESCPLSIERIMEYVRMESADTDESRTERLLFIRTAILADSHFWLWTYTELDGATCYVTFRRNSVGATHLGLSEANGLSPEQYLLAEYYDEVYW